MQVDGRATLPQAAVQDQLPSLGGEFPPFECPERYENRTIVFKYVREGTPVRIFAIKVHLSRVTQWKAWHSDDAHYLLGRLFLMGLTGLCGGGAMPRRTGRSPVTTRAE